MRNAGLDEAQAGIKIAGRNINNLRHADDTTLMAESEEELKSLLMEVKEESEEAGFKLNIQKTKVMASGPIMSWQIDGEATETVTEFIFLGSKITFMISPKLGSLLGFVIHHPFHTVHGVLKARILKLFAIPSPVDHVLSEPADLPPEKSVCRSRSNS